MNLKDMTGLQIMQAIASGELHFAPIAKTVPMEFEAAEEGRVVFKATANETHTNPMGGVHGAGVGYGTIELNVKMCKPVPFNKTLIAEGKVINKTRRLVISEGYLRDETGSLYAYATATNMILS